MKTLSAPKSAWNFGVIANYRSDMKNVLCEVDLWASKLASCADAPHGCKSAPLDSLTYGAMSYNPMDASGAMGPYFKVGASYKLF